MKKSIMLVALVSFFGISLRASNDPMQDIAAEVYGYLAQEMIYKLAQETVLVERANEYVAFLAQCGAQERGDIKAAVQHLFAVDCVKVINGKTVIKNFDELYAQMAGLHDIGGTWNITLLDSVIVDGFTNKIVLHYEIATEKLGSFTVMKFLHVTQDGLIDEINEIYHALEQ